MPRQKGRADNLSGPSPNEISAAASIMQRATGLMLSKWGACRHSPDERANVGFHYFRDQSRQAESGQVQLKSSPEGRLEGFGHLPASETLQPSQPASLGKE